MSSPSWILHPNPTHSSFPVHGSAIVTVLILWKTHIISASDDHSIHVHSSHGDLVRSLEGHQGGVWALALHGDTLVSGATDRTTRIWDLQTGVCRQVFRNHTSTVRSLVIAEPVADAAGELWPKQPLIVTGSRDKTMCVWTLPGREDAEYKDVDDANDGEASTDAYTNPYFRFRCEGHDHAIRDLSAVGRTVASASYDSTVRVWDLITGQCLWVLTGHTSKVYCVILDASRNQVYSASMDSTVRIWDLSNGSCKHILSRHESLVGLLSISPSFLLSGAADGLVCVWDPSSGELINHFRHDDAVTAIQLDDFKILSGSAGQLRLLDLKSGQVRDLLSMERNRVALLRVAFAGSLCVAAIGGDVNSMEVWDFGDEGN